MNEEQQKRALILLKATLDILNKCIESRYVLDVASVTAIWDNAECDGYCLKEEVEELLESLLNEESRSSSTSIR